MGKICMHTVSSSNEQHASSEMFNLTLFVFPEIGRPALERLMKHAEVAGGLNLNVIQTAYW